jgi:hypothetical protein
MKRQVATAMLGAILILGTATASFAQSNGNAVGGGAAGGPGATSSEPTAGGGSGNNGPASTSTYGK